MGAIQQALSGLGSNIPALTYAKWNFSDRSGFIGGTGNTANMGGATGSIRATQGKNAGKWYWECTVSTSSDATVYLGIASSAEVMTKWPGQSFDSAGYWGAGSIYTGGSAIASATAISSSDVIGFELDMNLRRIQIYRNGTAVTLQILGGSIPWFPCAGQLGASSASVVANFGATPFAYPVPSGFNPGVYI